ncbi:aryl-alcohol dehydrogenase-like predicted oxidoreductase [Lutibacter sp. Hel_I_33_5]|uniref:aldo/keto reductase n=1 Tax=Lutibacter sp. Hel_I_33_5 TaxID=1566289 RepID=UPI0011A7EAD2|nr:aldo/keto reductase [Lutibacter sp. Hel_I_33_5]TVZ56003.1 aryl-alcohol dehydrogenase-like predicted oxidoreductase [Lutibacter sp. Hel_I_33_5]
MTLGLGTAAIGRPQYINIRQKKQSEFDLISFKNEGFKVLEEAYNLGIRYFDTAPGYGLAEKLVLEWMKTKNDPSIEISTKWGYMYVADFNPKATIHEVKEHSLDKLNEQWEVSKNFLPNLKLYQIHSATLETGVLENQPILNKLATLKKEHQIKIGITTTGENQVEVIKKALAISVDGEPLFDTFQVTFNILEQSLVEVANELDKNGKKIIIKEALANGRLFKNNKYLHYHKLYKSLENLAKKYQVGIDAIALKFCKQNLPKSTILSGISNKQHLISNLEFTNFELSTDELQELKSFKVAPKEYWNERKQLTWN